MPLAKYTSDTPINATATRASPRNNIEATEKNPVRSAPFVMSVECPAARADERTARPLAGYPRPVRRFIIDEPRARLSRPVPVIRAAPMRTDLARRPTGLATRLR